MKYSYDSDVKNNFHVFDSDVISGKHFKFTVGALAALPFLDNPVLINM